MKKKTLIKRILKSVILAIPYLLFFLRISLIFIEKNTVIGAIKLIDLLNLTENKPETKTPRL